MIVIGSKQLKGVNKLKTLGSVARKVSETAHCPVMIIR
jgi:nucleotide-binding universal stress UspA family protein